MRTMQPRSDSSSSGWRRAIVSTTSRGMRSSGRIRPATTAMRTSNRRVRVALVASIVLLVGCAGGCGGEDEAAAQRCVDEARNAAEAAVVAEYYERGGLGPKAE